MYPLVYIVIVLSLLTAIGRFFIPGHNLTWPGTYEAFAHIWVGYLIAIIIFFWNDMRGKVAALCLAFITVLEIIMFLMR
jgi:hypothetical protein